MPASGLSADVRFELPGRPIFFGEYVRVPVDASGSGLDFDDLTFEVKDGLEGGDVSLSRDAAFVPERPEIMLLAGYRPGSHMLQALSGGTVVGEAEFEITDLWDDERASPPLWFNGLVPAYTTGATWGGGPSTGPQNLGTRTATGPRRVAVLFVDTSSQRYTTDAPTLADFRARWQQHLLDGFVGTDGVSRSVKRFYEEVSYGLLHLDGQVFSTVVNLPGAWASYFDGSSSERAKGEFVNQCVTAADGAGLNLTGFDMIVCVTQPVTPAAPASPLVAWPYGGYGVNVNTSHGPVTGRGISMPNTWGDGSMLDQGSGRTIFQTLTHEMGHTLNLNDLYQPAVNGRNLGSWDPMASESTLPHFTLAHRMMLGWVGGTWVRRYDFQSLGSTVDETVSLAPVELGAPPAGSFAGIEVRIGDGRNYYCEYRRGQAGEIGDEQLTPNARIVATDVSEPPDPPVISRPEILLLVSDGDDDGPVLDAGQLYHELDSSSPTYPADFRLDVVSVAPGTAQVRVRYAVVGRPDPAIRPWPRDAAHQWQSPDVEVRNPRASADPANWANVPWLGHDNTVVAHVTNQGTLSAPGVVTRFYVKDYTVGGAPETFIGVDRHDVAPGATVEFSTTWNPPAPADPARPQHFCLVVRIESYATPTSPAVYELNDNNNVAQSNYDRFISVTASPATREITGVTVGNPFDEPTTFYVRGGQSNPLYRVYLEHTWLRLEPGETRRVQVMLEYAPDALQSDPRIGELSERYLQRRNEVGIVGLIDDPRDPHPHGPRLVSGVSAHVVTGRATRFHSFEPGDDRAIGEVVTVEDGRPVRDGKVLVISETPDGERVYQEVRLDGGRFGVGLEARWAAISAYYVPAEGYADCTSERVER